MGEAQVALFHVLHWPEVLLLQRLRAKSHQQPSLCRVGDTHRSTCPLREVKTQVALVTWGMAVSSWSLTPGVPSAWQL